MDKSAILGYECESAQEEESETIGSRQLGPPLPSMRVPPCLPSSLPHSAVVQTLCIGSCLGLSALWLQLCAPRRNQGRELERGGHTAMDAKINKGTHCNGLQRGGHTALDTRFKFKSCNESASEKHMMTHLL